jgi:predicted nucleic acid-binding protein
MGLSCLTDSKVTAVIDASTAINLNATGCAGKILRALPNRIVMTDVILGELKECRLSGRRDAELIAELVQASLIAIVPLSELQQRHFESLVIGRGIDTLDDGEAATIAYAVESGAIALIDERKAIRICAERYPQVPIGCTVDLFTHEGAQKSLRAGELGDAVFSALQHARMRVLPRHMEWVVGLIGQERTRQCPSLPRASRISDSLLTEAP